MKKKENNYKEKEFMTFIMDIIKKAFFHQSCMKPRIAQLILQPDNLFLNLTISVLIFLNQVFISFIYI